jgi:hypothetical protein
LRIETAKQGSRQNYDSQAAVVAIKSLNAMVVKDYEDKTSGSVLHGLVYAHECALLVNFRIHDAKKNPGGRTGYLEKY